jgi:5-(aminomethyl)-3-furanmethanol phosphate kinase
MNSEASGPALLVVKVGGSLYDLADLGPRLERWLAEQRSPAVLLVPGGGPAADVVRDLDRRHGLGEAVAHSLALQALRLNAHFLAELLGRVNPGRQAAVTGEITELPSLWRAGKLPILEAVAFADADDHRAGHLPHCWEVTSDALAARVAVVARASRLVLLKSASSPAGQDWREAGRRGYVDRYFASVVSMASAPGFEVQALNFREWQPAPFRNADRSGEP